MSETIQLSATFSEQANQARADVHCVVSADGKSYPYNCSLVLAGKLRPNALSGGFVTVFCKGMRWHLLGLLQPLVNVNSETPAANIDTLDLIEELAHRGIVVPQCSTEVVTTPHPQRA